jgi:hypothetical protein
MDAKRYRDIEIGMQPLTRGEVIAGWFFCCDWNQMLIHKDSKEALCCSCRAKKGGINENMG